jgi:hypothetical protein
MPPNLVKYALLNMIMYTYIHTCIGIYIQHTYIQHTYTHAYIHTCIHTYIHIHAGRREEGGGRREEGVVRR